MHIKKLNIFYYFISLQLFILIVLNKQVFLFIFFLFLILFFLIFITFLLEIFYLNMKFLAYFYLEKSFQNDKLQVAI